MASNQPIIGNLGVFDYKTQEWKIFLGRLTMFIKINKKAFEGSENALLLTHLSDDTYRLVCNLLHPKKVDDATFVELKTALNNHFTPKRSTFADRSKFYGATKYDCETVEEWVARLRGLAVYCEFGTEFETLLRDRFILGFKSGPERDRLFEQDIKTLTLAKAIEVAQQAACARQARAAVGEDQRIKEEPVFKLDGRRRGAGSSRGARAGGSQSRCDVCGLKSHDAKFCRYKGYKCKICGVVGHLKKMCNANKVHNIENQSESEHNCEECNVYNMRVELDTLKGGGNIRQPEQQDCLGRPGGSEVTSDTLEVRG
ncbi:hypothetical protein NE865_10874 [Phthorimaea operculella]|nr:hypothetical protein NE865_10874 [Phthorimaea operculella]